jgi:hypothetical protein
MVAVRELTRAPVRALTRATRIARPRLLRALFVALEEWVRTGTAPPSSRVPSIAQGTAVAAEAIKMPTMPGVALPPGANCIGPPVDWVEPPARLDNFYSTRVCVVGADGNEVTGVRLPSGPILGGTSIKLSLASYAIATVR